jgi:hypothetical protein
MNLFKIVILIYGVLLSSCISPSVIKAPPPPVTVREYRVEPITPEVFAEADTDEDGKLSVKEAKNLPKKPIKKEPTGHLGAFLSIVISVVVVCVIGQLLFCKRKTKTDTD